ncbi:hypothetical protein [Polaribacter sp. AHE13PA]|uniref:hypothetical protein n=1 Tax=Polaribacter sp. AHE13PA TaxID=2745562 RepID=UPI001C4E40A0|nr:hypothetical protein [Polaribacter sp. AHE13PA]QXP66469.1 hypothetical protein H0I28_15055 [Polaribacter sp. AHE13PA]
MEKQYQYFKSCLREEKFDAAHIFKRELEPNSMEFKNLSSLLSIYPIDHPTPQVEDYAISALGQLIFSIKSQLKE